MLYFFVAEFMQFGWTPTTHGKDRLFERKHRHIKTGIETSIHCIDYETALAFIYFNLVLSTYLLRCPPTLPSIVRSLKQLVPSYSYYDYTTRCRVISPTEKQLDVVSLSIMITMLWERLNISLGSRNIFAAWPKSAGFYIEKNNEI